MLWKFLPILSCQMKEKPSSNRALKSWIHHIRYRPPARVSYRQLLSPDVGLPGLGLEDEHASGTEMSIDPLEEPLEAAVPPVEVNPFGDAQAHDHVVLRPLSHEQVVVLQNIVGLQDRGKAPWGKLGWERTNYAVLLGTTTSDVNWIHTRIYWLHIAKLYLKKTYVEARNLCILISTARH